MNQEQMGKFLIAVREGEMSPSEAARLIIEANNPQKSAFFHISDQMDKLNAAVKGTSGLTFFVDYSEGLIVKLTVVQPATEKVHNFSIVITPEMMKNNTRSDEEIIVSLFAPIFDALKSIQIVPSVSGGILLDTKGDPIVHKTGNC